MDDPFDLPPDVLRRVPLFAEIAKVLSWSGGPVNWDLARQIAVSVAASAPATTTGSEDVSEQVRLAELWLSESASLPSPGHLTTARAATPAGWAEHAPTALGEIVDPVASKIVSAIEEQARGITEEQAGVIAQSLGQLAPMLLGMQAGAILGTLAADITGDHELGLPIMGDQIVLVLPTIDRIATDYGLDPRAVRQWVALRAAAHRMILEGFPWVRGHFFALYHDYVASLEIDLAEGMRRLQGLDLSDPTGLQDALGQDGIFSTTSTPEAARAAERIAAFLSLLDAHTALACERAGQPVGDPARLAEAFRRRAAGGAGAAALSGFIGIDPGSARRPATEFVGTVVQRAGWSALNRMWEETGSFPTDAELSDPADWLQRVAP